jgi:trans-aconitate 2-methyltransferase
MAPWDPDQYLKFEDERSRPCRDLLTALSSLSPARVVDLGCGPGTSTALIRSQWPSAHVVGLDNSPEMITLAEKSSPAEEWVQGDIASWKTSEPVDLVFSNAALQWVPDHAALFPRLLESVAVGGALAVQMPVPWGSEARKCIQEVAQRPEWSTKWESRSQSLKVEPPEAYYDILVPRSTRVDLWVTEYIHVLPDAAAIVEWFKGTGLRPYLAALGTEPERDAFVAQIRDAIAAAYSVQPDGRVLFPFRRLFVIAFR